MSKTKHFIDQIGLPRLFLNLPEVSVGLVEFLVRVGALTADELAEGLRTQAVPADAPEARQIGEILVAQQVVQPPQVG